MTSMLTVREAAEFLGLRPATIRAWILRRTNLEVVKVGRSVRIKRESLQRFIEANTIPPRRD